jgi:enterochelin esterase-like enzyme
MNNRRMQHVSNFLPALLLAGSACLAQEAPPPPLISPDISSDSDTTFRIRAPAANTVSLVSGGDIPGVPFGGGAAFDRKADGVWELTLENLPSGAYRYAFTIDGVRVSDPSNPRVSQSNGNAWSLFYVPGSGYMDTQSVPHGAVAEVHYFSSVLGRHRRMHVYTPPGYEHGAGRYPVFYLLHGAFDSDDSWSSVGRAGFILDNLIAAGEAEPMLVVMPDGHTGPFRPGGPSGLPLDEFAREFAADIRPYIEANFRVLEGRRNTAIAGLSMGGAQTLEIAMRNLRDYGYIGVFSSGVFGVTQDSSWQDAHAPVLGDERLRAGVELMWFSTGRDDFVLETTEATVALLEHSGFDVEYHESAGGHTWINWREYLQAFTPRLFR